MGCLHHSTLQCTIVHCSAFLVGGLKRAPQIFFLNFFVWVVLFRHNYGPVNQKKTHQNFSCKVGKSTSICAIDLAVQHMSHTYSESPAVLFHMVLPNLCHTYAKKLVNRVSATLANRDFSGFLSSGAQIT